MANFGSDPIKNFAVIAESLLLLAVIHPFVITTFGISSFAAQVKGILSDP